MEQSGCDIARMITIRRDFHKHAEIAFEEHLTQQKLIDYMTEWGIPADKITKCAGTGLVVDM